MRVASFFLAAAVAAHGQAVSLDQRRQDLQYVRTELPRLHPNLFSVTPRAVFEAAARELEDAVGALGVEAFYARLAGLVALGRDSHTALGVNSTSAQAAGFAGLPVLFREFDDGVFVTAAGGHHLFLNEARVLRVGGVAVEEVWERLRPVVAHENEWWFRAQAPQYMRNLGVLRGLGLAPMDGPARFTVRLATGEEREVELGASAAALIRPVQQTAGFTPVTLRRTDEFYWVEYWPETRTLYIAYRQCQEMPAKPIAAFVAEIAALARGPVETTVFDLRGNSGGNSSYFTRLLQAVRPVKGRGFALIDRGVFSSGMFAVWDLLGTPGITTVGEPIGGKPGSYGEVLTVSLPGSRMLLQHSTRYFAAPVYVPAGDTIAPGLAVPLPSTDYFARHDPYLAAVFAGAGAFPAPPAGEVLVVNGASFRPETGIAPGSFAAAFGLFAEPPAAVEVNGVAVPVVGATAQQAVFRVPEDAVPGLATVGVGALRGEFTITAAGPGLFIADPGNPEQPAAVLRPGVRPGEVVELFGTGYPADFAAEVWMAQRPAEVGFSGVAPGFPGLWQINAQVPAGDTLRGLVPVFLRAGGRVSNPVTIRVE